MRIAIIDTGIGKGPIEFVGAVLDGRPQPVTLDLIQDGLDWYWDDTRIVTESQKSVRRDSDGTQWRVTVPANGEATITATFETRY